MYNSVYVYVYSFRMYRVVENKGRAPVTPLEKSKLCPDAAYPTTWHTPNRRSKRIQICQKEPMANVRSAQSDQKPSFSSHHLLARRFSRQFSCLEMCLLSIMVTLHFD